MTFLFDTRQEMLREPSGLRASENLAETFRNNADLLLKLADMQATLEGSFYRALAELRRVQGLRKEREEARAAKLKQSRQK